MLVRIGRGENPKLDIDGTAIIPTYTGDSFTVPVDGVGAIASVQIGGETLTLAMDPSDPQPGEFTFANGQLTVNIFSAPPSGTALHYHGQAATYPNTPGTGLIEPIPQLFLDWNVDGDFTINESFEGHPSASFSFQIKSSEVGKARDYFRNGTPFTLYGVGFRVVNFDREVEPGGWSRCTVQLGGKHEAALSKPIRLLPLVQASGNNPRLGALSIHAIANAAGTAYKGPAIAYPVPESITAQTKVTLGSILKKHARVVGCFQVLSHPDYVELRPWHSTKIHAFSPADVNISGRKISVSTPGDRAIVDGIQTMADYQNTELTLASIQGSEPDDAEPPAIITTCDAPSNFSQVPRQLKAFARQLEIADQFDNGGDTSGRTCTTTEGGTITGVESEKYGAAFHALDIYTLDTDRSGGGASVFKWAKKFGVNPSDFWQPIERLKESVSYRDDGYITGKQKGGWKLARFKTDETSGNPRLLELEEQLQLGGELERFQFEALVNFQKAYTIFFKLPIVGQTTIELEPFPYPDILQQQRDARLNGEDFVVPHYAARITTTETSYAVAENPESSEFRQLPPIAVGKRFHQEIITTITSTRPGEESFNVRTLTKNAEGANFEKVHKTDVTRSFQGRVKPAERKPTGDKWRKKPFRLGVNDDSLIKRVLSSAGSPPDAISDGSVSYPTFDLEIARVAAELDLEIANTLGSETIPTTVRFRAGLEVGDRLHYDWGEGSRLYYVLSKSVPRRYPVQGVVECPGIDIALGRNLKVPVIAKEVAE